MMDIGEKEKQFQRVTGQRQKEKRDWGSVGTCDSKLNIWESKLNICFLRAHGEGSLTGGRARPGPCLSECSVAKQADYELSYLSHSLSLSDELFCLIRTQNGRHRAQTYRQTPSIDPWFRSRLHAVIEPP